MRIRYTLLAAALTLLGFGIGPARVARADCAPTATVCRRLQDAKQTQAAANQQLLGIQQSLADAQTKATQTKSVIDQLQAQIAALQAKIAQMRSKLAATAHQIQVTQSEITRQEANLQVRQELLARRVRTLDQHGTADYMELFVTSRSFS